MIRSNWVLNSWGGNLRVVTYFDIPHRISTIRNFFYECSRLPSKNCKLQNKEKSNMLNQGNMHFVKGNRFLQEYLKLLNRDYRHGLQWTDLGPPLVHKAANQYLGRDSGLDSEPVNSNHILAIIFRFKICLNC